MPNIQNSSLSPSVPPEGKEPALAARQGPPKGKKLLDQYRDALRLKRYSPRTEDTYPIWVKNYILYHNKRHPKEMGVPEIGQFLTHLVSSK